MTSAIEEAVVALVVEGARDALWSFAGPEDSVTQEFLAAYDARRDRDGRRDVFDRLPLEGGGGLALEVAAGLGRIEGDYADPSAQPVGSATVTVPVRGGLSLGLRAEGGLVDINARGEAFFGGALVARGRLVPSARVTPTLSFGLGGLAVPSVETGPFVYGTATAGIEGRLSRAPRAVPRGRRGLPLLGGARRPRGLGDRQRQRLGGPGGRRALRPFLERGGPF